MSFAEEGESGGEGKTVTKTIYPDGRIEDEDEKKEREKKQEEEGVQEIHKLAFQQEWRALKEHIEKKKKAKEYYDLNVQDKRGMTPLHLSTYKGFEKHVKYLLEEGADFDVQDYTGISPLHIACQKGHLKIAKMLLEAGAHEEMKAKEGWTPLYIAAQQGNDKLIELLLDFGADVEYLPSKLQFSPLHIACLRNHLDAVDVLLRHKTPVNLVDRQNVTCLHIATENQNVEMVKYLLHTWKKTIQVDALAGNETTALHLAVTKGNKAITQTLLQHGAEIDRKDSFGRTAIHKAVEKANEEIVQILIKAGADPNVQDPYGFTPLYVASQLNFPKVARVLLENGALPNTPNFGGFTPAHKAAELRKTDVLELLIKYKADLNQRTKDHQTPLHCACSKGSKEVVKLLIDHQVKLDVQDEGAQSTPLHIAASNLFFQKIFMLVQSGAKVNVKNKSGKIAYDVIVESLQSKSTLPADAKQATKEKARRKQIMELLELPVFRLLLSDHENWRRDEITLWFAHFYESKKVMELLEKESVDGKRLNARVIDEILQIFAKDEDDEQAELLNIHWSLFKLGTRPWKDFEFFWDVASSKMLSLFDMRSITPSSTPSIQKEAQNVI